MDVLLQITPIGDTTPREISAASQELRDALEHLPGVAGIEPHRVSAPDHAKGGLANTLGGLVLSVAPAVLKTVLQTLKAVLSRQPSLTKILIKTRDETFNFEFDPKKISLQELVSAAERLGAMPPTT
jgi:hypothetical protein